jgi:hypothetical protein
MAQSLYSSKPSFSIFLRGPVDAFLPEVIMITESRFSGPIYYPRYINGVKATSRDWSVNSYKAIELANRALQEFSSYIEAYAPIELFYNESDLPS